MKIKPDSRGLDPAIQISPLALDSRLKGGYDDRMRTAHQ